MTTESEQLNIVPLKERIKIRNKKIKDLYKIGYSGDEICEMTKLSKTTVFFAINGRSKKKTVAEDKKISN